MRGRTAVCICLAGALLTSAVVEVCVWQAGRNAVAKEMDAFVEQVSSGESAREVAASANPLHAACEVLLEGGYELAPCTLWAAESSQDSSGLRVGICVERSYGYEPVIWKFLPGTEERLARAAAIELSGPRGAEDEGYEDTAHFASLQRQGVGYLVDETVPRSQAPQELLDVLEIGEDAK